MYIGPCLPLPLSALPHSLCLLLPSKVTVWALVEVRVMSLGLSTWLLHSKGLAPEKFALGALPVTSLKTKLEWIQAWLLNSNTKECCKMEPSGFRLMVFKVTYGTVKKQGVLPPRYHPVWWPHGNDMSCLSMQVLMSTCFVHGALTDIQRETRTVGHDSCPQRATTQK